MTAPRGQLTAYLSRIPSVLGVVVSNDELRRVLLAFAGFNAVEWGTWLSMMVYAYAQGGATTAGLVAVGQLVPAALFAPVAAVLGDRHRPGRMLALGYLMQALTVLATAGALLRDADPLLVYVVGGAASVAMTTTRPLQSALVPTLARTPLELSATNVTTGWLESVTVLGAPALTGVLLAISGPGLAFAVFGCVSLVAVALISGVAGPLPSQSVPGSSPFAELAQGVRLLRREPEPRTLVILLGAQFVAIGALDVLYPALALDALHAGDAWAGYLNAAFGAGGALGIGATVALVGRRHLITPLVLGVGGWSLAFLALAFVTTRASALVLLAVAGVGRLVLDVAGRTLLQRSAPGDLLARIFGLLEGLSMAGLALGSALVPTLIALGGTRAALLGVAAVLPVAVLLTGRRLRTIDRTANVPIVEIGLLRALPLFATLPAPTLESIARSLEPVDAPAGTVVVAQDDIGDRWYAVADGRLTVARNGEQLAELGRGTAFGEIALLRDVPRTATVTAVTDCALFALEKSAFLEAVTGNPQAVETAERVVASHLATHR